MLTILFQLIRVSTVNFKMITVVNQKYQEKIVSGLKIISIKNKIYQLPMKLENS